MCKLKRDLDTISGISYWSSESEQFFNKFAYIRFYPKPSSILYTTIDIKLHA